MIIHQYELSQEKGHATIRVPIEYEQSNELPAALWFRLPVRYRESVSTSAHAFVVALLLCAMHQREDLHIEGRVSAVFLENLEHVQRLFHTWRPEWYARIRVFATQVVNEQHVARADGALFPFSGGADSFHCLYTHLPQRLETREDAVTHALFVHGFDIPLTDTATFREASRSYQGLMDTLGVNFIPVATNLRQFHNKPDWDAAAIMAVCGTALLFENVAGSFYYPEINTYDYEPAGSRPVQRSSYFFENPVAAFLSSDRMRIENRGGAVSKIEKIAAFAHWPQSFDRLRVCWEQPNGLQNCGRCSKCVLTMSALELEAALSSHSNFTAPLRRSDIRASRFAANRFYFPETWIQYARSKGRKDIVFDYQYALLMSRIRSFLDSITNRFI